MNSKCSHLLQSAGLAVLIVLIGAALARGQAERQAEVIAAGGGTSSSSSVTLHATVGQTAAMPATSSSSVTLEAGFWPMVVLSEQSATPRPEDASEQLPAAFHLEPAYPNPFNPVTRIGYSLPEPVEVRLTVYNALGERVRTLVDGRQPAGEHEITFRAAALPSGIYYYRLQAGSYREVKAVSLVK